MAILAGNVFADFDETNRLVNKPSSTSITAPEYIHRNIFHQLQYQLNISPLLSMYLDVSYPWMSHILVLSLHHILNLHVIYIYI